MNYLAVFIGGGLGSVTRFSVTQLMQFLGWISFPVATLLSNIVATTLLSVLVITLKQKGYNDPVSLFWMTGFCGGFSTFSTFSIETFSLLSSGQLGWAIANVLLNLLLCLLMVLVIWKFQ